MGRLKTGTPARIKLSSINLGLMEEQPGDKNPPPMSILQPPQATLPQISCYITRTNKQTHQIISDNTHLSAMYSGKISGIGPRYCPSIEDKINKFSEKDSHQIFIEPEGLDKGSSISKRDFYKLTHFSTKGICRVYSGARKLCN
jgi:tRNA uridine 5-carboxymethylaminomethyl modification enzyme